MLGSQEIEKLYIGSAILYQKSSSTPSESFFCKLELTDGTIVDIDGNGELTKAMVATPYASTLYKMHVGNLCTSIGSQAAAQCKQLVELVIDEGVTTINSAAFNGDSKLGIIDFPSTLTSIGNYCFHNMAGTCNITFRGLTPPTISIGNNNRFSAANTNIYVPDSSLSTYQTAWSELATKIKPQSQLLPREYTELNYISSTSTGGQYIDLGCKLLQNTDDIQIDIKFNIKGEGKTSTGSDARLSTLISSQPEVSPWPGFVLRRFSTANTNIHLQAKWQFTNSVARTSKYDSKYLSYGNNGTTNATTFGTLCEFSEILDNIPSSQINDTTCTLFCSFDASNNPFRFCEADLYYLRFKKGNTIIRNLVPAKRNSDNEIGLYDLQNNVFYISQGTESFVTGT